MISKFFETTDDFLRGHGLFQVDHKPAGRLKWLFALVFVYGAGYGMVMGCFSGLAVGRYHQLLYIGLKVPILLLVTFILCLPSFFVINTLAGLREDFSEALSAVVSTQACVATVLAGLAPLTGFFYVCSNSYDAAILFNGLMFGIATLSAQRIVRRYYSPLIQRNKTHRAMLFIWLLLYVFVGIQMAWVLRPFVGDPNAPVVFFRTEAWGNAYVVIIRLIG